MTLPQLTFRSLLALGLALAGCGTSGADSSSAVAEPAATHIAVLYRNRCGSCHRPVAPGSEPADKLHAALLDHRKRTRLTEREWAGIEAFLAPSASPH